MQYTTLLAFLSAPLIAFAQTQENPNAFNNPDAFSATGGEPVELSWDPTTDGTVTLVLRSGSSNNLQEGTVIASNLENSGSYTWTPDNDLTRGSDYTVEIVDDNNPENVNYTPYFVLDTDNTVASQTSIVSLGSATAAPDLSTASPTGAASTLTGVSAESTSTAGDMATTIDNVNINPTMSSSMSAGASDSSAASPASETAASSTEDLNAPEQSDNAGSKKTYMGAMLGALALGAAAL